MIDRPRRTFQGVDAFLPQEPLYIDSEAATTRASYGIDCLKVLTVMLPQHEFTDVLKQYEAMACHPTRHTLSQTHSCFMYLVAPNQYIQEFVPKSVAKQLSWAVPFLGRRYSS